MRYEYEDTADPLVRRMAPYSKEAHSVFATSREANHQKFQKKPIRSIYWLKGTGNPSSELMT